MAKKAHPQHDALRDVLSRITTVAEAGKTTVIGARVDLGALDDAEAKRALTPAYRVQRQQEIRETARKQVTDGVVQALALGRATLAQRESLTGIQSVLEGARLVELESDKDRFGMEAIDKSEILQRNELRLLREEFMRARLRQEMLDQSPDELAATITAAAAAGELGVLGIAQKVLNRRKAADFDGTAPARQAMQLALDAVPLPPEVQELAPTFDGIQRQVGKLEDVLREVNGGFVAEHDRGAKIDRLKELIAEVGETEAPHAFAAEQEALRTGRATDVRKRAALVVRQVARTNDTDTKPAA